MAHQVTLNGKVHPDRNKEQIVNFLKRNKIANFLSHEKVFTGDHLDYLISNSRDTGTKIYKHVIDTDIPILNEEWMKDVVEKKEWVEPLEHHLIKKCAMPDTSGDGTSQPGGGDDSSDNNDSSGNNSSGGNNDSSENHDKTLAEATTAARMVKDAADLAVAGNVEAQMAFQSGDAKAVATGNRKAYDSFILAKEQFNVVEKLSKNVNGDLKQAILKVLSSASVELSRAETAAGNANNFADAAKVQLKTENDGSNRIEGTPDITDVVRSQQKATEDAEAAGKAAREAIAHAQSLRQQAEAKAKDASTVKEAAGQKEGPEKDAELSRYREKSAEAVDALAEAQLAEETAKKAEETALVTANAAGLPPPVLYQQTEQSPWGDVLETTSTTPKGRQPHDRVMVPARVTKATEAAGVILGVLPRGQLLVAIPAKKGPKAFILSSTFALARKHFKDGGGELLEYEDPDEYEGMSIWHLQPLVVAVQKSKGSRPRNMLAVLLAKVPGSDKKRLFNLTILREIWAPGMVAEFMNAVAERQSQPAICAVSVKQQVEDEEDKRKEMWKDRYAIKPSE
ncbi:hypothetical protein FALBO_4850 [Fusarium albosuccineum]|uniref:BRCT domain-containing protein n=1 Tax=Fusarium albosuccineum TaxID=1237068 RepID=A0A8H4LG93_9HYPO|nr:hypothetical protein FALBO_4850 [Fusarium albosuccineum]